MMHPFLELQIFHILSLSAVKLSSSLGLSVVFQYNLLIRGIFFQSLSMSLSSIFIAYECLKSYLVPYVTWLFQKIPEVEEN